MTDETDLAEGVLEGAAADRRKISPAADRRVRHEGSGELLEPKTTITWSPYWQRRADDGDVIVHAGREKKD